MAASPRTLRVDASIYCLQKRGGISRYLSMVLPSISREYDLVDYILPCSRSVNALPQSNRAPTLAPLLMSRLTPLRAKAGADLFLPADRFFLRSRGCGKVYYTVHDCIPERYGSWAKARVYRAWRKRAVDLADVIIFVSEATKQRFIEIYGSPKRSAVIHHGFSYPSPDAIGGTAVPIGHPMMIESESYLLYVGPRAGYKNFALAEQWKMAFPSGPKIICVGGEPAPAKKVEGVIYLQDVLDNELTSLYRGALGVLITSLEEGFGLVGLEAMAHDVPVIALDTEVAREIYGDAASYFSDVDSLDAKIRQVNEDVSFQNEIVASGRERLNNFSWSSSQQAHRLVVSGMLY